MSVNSFSPELRVLILAPTAKDAEVTASILENQNIYSHICTSLPQLCQEIERGADAALITLESILADKDRILEKLLKTQAPWSDFPLIVLTPAGHDSAPPVMLQTTGNMTLIARPVQIAVLISTVQAALRDRKRQYRIRDYLQEREAQALALEISEKRTRSVIDTALDAVVMADSAGIILEWNRQAEIIFGWKHAEAIGRQMSELIIPEQYREMHHADMARYIATGENSSLNQRIEITALHKSGSIFPVELTITSQHHGADIVFTSFMRDITERLKAEQAIQDAHSYLELMVESARDFAIISTDRDGNIVSWNTGASNVFGYRADEVIGSDASIIFTPEDRQRNVPQHEMARAAQTGHASDERWHLRKNGERFYVSGVMAAMLDKDKNIKGFLKIASDHTERKTAEEAIIAARNAAEAANIAKTEFLANMSHEIRTPMNAVIGLSNILAMSEPLTSRQRDFIKTLQMSADSLLALINDLLDIAKIEARTVDLEQVPFSLTQLVQEVISMMAVRVREKGLQFSSDGESFRHKMFIGDPTRIRQIVLNLCSNAIKFTESGGVHVSITCTCMNDPDMETVSISVKDTGIGISPQRLETMFEKFVQADSSINRKYGGTGLGLAITKTLTEIMGGRIQANSVIGEGSTFTVEIPLKIARDKDIQDANYSLPEIIQGTQPEHLINVLLVEDYAPNVLVASTFIEEFGYRCDVASNGLEAVEKVKEGQFAAVLMDVQMHGMNGLEATKLIREHERMQKKTPVPIIGMTAHALAGDRERCLAAGMDNYISKPFNPAELQAMLSDFLYNERNLAVKRA